MERGDTKEDIYRKFEREVRTPGHPLLVDAFLPDAAEIPTAFAPPPPPPSMPEEDTLRGLDADAPEHEPHHAPEHGADCDREHEKPQSPRRAAPRKPASAPPKKEPEKSLEDEIAEFMNRDQRGLSPDDDLSTFATSLDPNLDPEPEPGPGSGSKD